MKKIVKFTFFVILFVAVSDLTINSLNLGPVWLWRIFGYDNVVKKMCSPQWINNEEFYYLEVVNYYDSRNPFIIFPVPPSFFTFKRSNADFLIYKVNINDPDNKKLIRKITQKVNFDLLHYSETKIRGEAIFRIAEDKKNMVLITQMNFKYFTYGYFAYFMDINGRILKERKFGFSWLDGKKIYDISSNLKKLLVYGDGEGFYIKDIASGKEVLFSDWKDKRIGVTGGSFKNRLISYNVSSPQDVHLTSPKKVRYKIFVYNEKNNITEPVCDTERLEFSSYDHTHYEILPSISDAAISSDDKFIFLSKIGIFKKEDEKWQLFEDLKDMKFNIYYPDFSPDGQRIVGVEDGLRIKVLELKELSK